MRDKLRTALEGSGRLHISIGTDHDRNVRLCVTEDWARLTAIERADLSAETLDEAEDPDQVIREELERLADKAHMNYKVKEDKPC